jgi:hypothetical protein
VVKRPGTKSVGSGQAALTTLTQSARHGQAKVRVRACVIPAERFERLRRRTAIRAPYEGVRATCVGSGLGARGARWRGE